MKRGLRSGQLILRDQFTELGLRAFFALNSLLLLIGLPIWLRALTRGSPTEHERGRLAVLCAFVDLLPLGVTAE